MSYQGYILLEHDDTGLSNYTEAFLKYNHKFTVMLSSGLLSHDQRFNFMDFYADTDAGYKLWPSLTVGQIRSMMYSGRVNVQNHSVGHINNFNFPDTVIGRQSLRLNNLPCTEFIKRMFGTEPIAFTPPFIGYNLWQEAYFNAWFQYWVGSLATNLNDWLNQLNTFALPQKLKALSVYDGSATGGGIVQYGWTWLTNLLTHLGTNRKLAIILMHDILWENISPNNDRNISPKNFKTLMNYLEPMRIAGNLVNFSDLPNL